MTNYVIVSPSYKRARQAKTQDYLPQCHYVVAKKEVDEYQDLGRKVIVCPDAAQGNLCRVLNWILNNMGERVLILDDDITRLIWFEREKPIQLSTEKATQFITKAFEIAEQWGARFFGVCPIPDKRYYREFTPFSTVSYIGGPFRGHINNERRYDERLSLKDDYDMTLQCLNSYRLALRFNMVSYEAAQQTGEGGCTIYRSSVREEEQNRLLIKKWGSEIVGRDDGRKTAGVRKPTTALLRDINPLIRAPIKGI